jgi:hypothetical protein
MANPSIIPVIISVAFPSPLDSRIARESHRVAQSSNRDASHGIVAVTISIPVVVWPLEIK